MNRAPFCSSCGTQALGSAARFCGGCGAAIVTPHPGASAQTSEPWTSPAGGNDAPELLRAVTDSLRLGALTNLLRGGERIINEQLGLVTNVLRTPEAQELGRRAKAIDDASGGTIQNTARLLGGILNQYRKGPQ